MRWARQENVQELRKCGRPITHYQRSYAKGKILFFFRNRTTHLYLILQYLESELMESKAKGSLSAQEYEKALSTLRKDFPQGIAACGSDALRYGLCHNDVSSKYIYFRFPYILCCLQS